MRVWAGSGSRIRGAFQGVRMQAFTSDHHALPLPPGHRFPVSKYTLLRQAVESRLPAVQLVAAPAAAEDELLLAHEPDYVSAVLEGWLTPAQQREIGFPWSERMAERSRRSVGAPTMRRRAKAPDTVYSMMWLWPLDACRPTGIDPGANCCVFW